MLAEQRLVGGVVAAGASEMKTQPPPSNDAPAAHAATRPVANANKAGGERPISSTFAFLGVAVDKNSTIYVTDSPHHRLRKVIFWTDIDGQVL